jgi:hypothetical protein
MTPGAQDHAYAPFWPGRIWCGSRH